MIKALNDIVQLLCDEYVVAYPTESVFGLGCDPDSEKAVQQLLALKKRSIDKGLILVAANYEQLQPYINDTVLTLEQRTRLTNSWPGPTTWVIPAAKSTPHWLTGQYKSLAVRVSAHPQVQQLCLAFGKPLVSTSANLSGLTPCKTEQQVQQQFGYELPIFPGHVGGRANPSEIRHLLTGELLRQG